MARIIWRYGQNINEDKGKKIQFKTSSARQKKKWAEQSGYSAN